MEEREGRGMGVGEERVSWVTGIERRGAKWGEEGVTGWEKKGEMGGVDGKKEKKKKKGKEKRDGGGERGGEKR